MDTPQPAPDHPDRPDHPGRYHRQTLFPGIGRAGQERLAGSRVLLIGCGALGSSIAELLARAGVGLLRIVDRDIVELTNLQRQALFDEEDVRLGAPKAAAAARRLRTINSQITIDERILDVYAGNIQALADGMHLLLDGTDNVQTRYLINDLAVQLGIPWIYGGCIGAEGRVMPILPGRGPCLRCLFPDPPPPGALATCDTAGIIGPAARAVASIQSAYALRILSGHGEDLAPRLLGFDLWEGLFHAIDADPSLRADCPCCGQRRFDFLEGLDRERTVALCGRNAVQIPAPAGPFDYEGVAQRLAAVGRVERTAWLLRFGVAGEKWLMTLFPDGRAIVQGTQDLAAARTIAAKYIGS